MKVGPGKNDRGFSMVGWLTGMLADDDIYNQLQFNPFVFDMRSINHDIFCLSNLLSLFQVSL